MRFQPNGESLLISLLFEGRSRHVCPNTHQSKIRHAISCCHPMIISSIHPGTWSILSEIQIEMEKHTDKQNAFSYTSLLEHTARLDSYGAEIFKNCCYHISFFSVTSFWLLNLTISVLSLFPHIKAQISRHKIPTITQSPEKVVMYIRCVIASNISNPLPLPFPLVDSYGSYSSPDACWIDLHRDRPHPIGRHYRPAIQVDFLFESSVVCFVWTPRKLVHRERENRKSRTMGLSYHPIIASRSFGSSIVKACRPTPKSQEQEYIVKPLFLASFLARESVRSIHTCIL